MISYSIKTLIIIIGAISAIYGISLYEMNSQISDEENKIIVTKSHNIKLISSAIENKFSEKMITLEIEGNHSSVQNVNYASYINETIKGIPSNLDLEKRQSAQRIISFDKDFNIVFFVMPNGDMYIQEPYSAQINNKVLNFAFRDWYKGAIVNHDTYVSEVYFSQATDRKAVAISEPIYFNNGALKGLWVGLINLDSLEQEISKLDFSHDGRIIVVDHNGHSIIDTEIVNDRKNFAIYTGLNSVTNALDGKSGSAIEVINGTKMFSIYEPLKIGSHVWAAVLTQPYDDVFGIISGAKELSIMTTIVAIFIMVITGFYVYKTTHANEILTRKLREDDIAKEEFTTMVSHELKTPLVTISGYAEMLQEKDGVLGILNDEQIKAVKKISTETAKLERLISDILDAQKIDLERMKFNKIEFKVDEFMEEQIQIHSKLMTDKKIHFVNTTREKISITSDPQRLSQVFANLIKNAIDFVPSNNGTIEINAHSKNDEVIFYVKDNGNGIPKEKQEELFKKFYQVDTSLKRSHGGTGLGLVICKGIVEALGGKIWLESEVGKGTRIFFTISKNDSNESHEN
ncbi:MAG: sensor histidine kinase [Nitrosotalea sp.]